jgi:hypothetical protein
LETLPIFPLTSSSVKSTRSITGHPIFNPKFLSARNLLI